MHKLLKVVVVIILLISTVSCGETQLALDCSSPRAFAESTNEMLKYLSKNGSTEEQQAFSMGIFSITMEFNKSGEDSDVLGRYDGWTIRQIIDYGS